MAANTGAITALAAAATNTGFYVFAAGDTGEVHASSYTFHGDELEARNANVSVFSDAFSDAMSKPGLAAVGTGDGVMAAVVYGAPDTLDSPVGTMLVPRDAKLGALGTPLSNPDWFCLDTALAVAADGTVAFLAQQSTEDITAKVVTPTGTDTLQWSTVVPSDRHANFGTITASRTGFLVTWSEPQPQAPQPAVPNLYARLLDTQLHSASDAIVAINPGGPGTPASDAEKYAGSGAHAAYAAAGDRYLFAWWFKAGSNGDEVWLSLRDGEFAPIGSSFQVSSGIGKSPRIAAGDDGFLVVWQQDGSPSGLAAERVGFDGLHKSLTIPNPGAGRVIAWDVVTRAGQPVLVWLQDTSSTLWLNPLCD